MASAMVINVYLEYGPERSDGLEPASIEFTTEWKSSFLPRVGDEVILPGFDDWFIVTRLAIAYDGDVYLSCTFRPGEQRSPDTYCAVLDKPPYNGQYNYDDR